LPKDPKEIFDTLISSGVHSTFDYSSLLVYQRKLSQWNRKVSITSVPDNEMMIRLILPSVWLGFQYSTMELGVIVDFGTGGGIPGIPMAITDSRNKYLLVDSNQKKSAFIKACIADKDVNVHGNMEMRTERIVEEEWEEKVDGIVTRGAGTILEIVRLWDGKLAGSGSLDFFKGEKADREIEDLRAEYPEAKAEIIAVPAWFENLKLLRIQIHS